MVAGQNRLALRHQPEAQPGQRGCAGRSAGVGGGAQGSEPGSLRAVGGSSVYHPWVSAWGETSQADSTALKKFLVLKKKEKL